MASNKTHADYEKEWREGMQEGIKRVNTRLDDLVTKVDNLRISEISMIKAELAVLKVKSGVWGFMAGAIPATVVAIYIVLHK